MKDYADKEEYFRCNVKSPLTMAILEEKPDVTRFLIDQGANVNFIIQEPFEKTFISPLIAAVQKNDVYLTKLLLEKGAKVVINNVSVDHYVTGSTSRVIVEALNQAK
jgi:ankyrin repeat protein